MTDTEPSRPSAPEPVGARGRGLVAGLGVVVVAALALVTVVALGKGSDVSRLEDERDVRQEAATVAATFGEVYLTYDFDDVDASSDKVLDLVTDDFAKDFEDTRAPGIEELFANLETTTEATTTEVFVGDVTDGAARVLVVVDVDATSAASGTQTLTDLTFVLDLVRVGDEWRVDKVAPAPQPDLEGDTPATTATTAAP